MGANSRSLGKQSNGKYRVGRFGMRALATRSPRPARPPPRRGSLSLWNSNPCPSRMRVDRRGRAHALPQCNRAPSVPLALVQRWISFAMQCSPLLFHLQPLQMSAFHDVFSATCSSFQMSDLARSIYSNLQLKCPDLDVAHSRLQVLVGEEAGSRICVSGRPTLHRTVAHEVHDWQI